MQSSYKNKMNKIPISPELELSLEDVLGKFIAILGIRGSGKTNTAAVLLEELLRYNVPLTIVDVDGEYWGLKEKYEILVVGKSENVDIEIEVEHSEKIAEFSITRNLPVILDISGYLSEEAYYLLLTYFKRIWDLAGKYRKPYEIVLEEAHEFIPQGIKTNLKDVLVRIALRGRKRGLGAVVISQRSARVEKDVLTQAEILFLHKVIHPADLRVYKEIVPLPSKEVLDIITSLNVGECIFYYSEICKPIQIRKRKTFHAGYTPQLTETKVPQLKAISQEIINSLKKLTKPNDVERKSVKQLIEENKRLKAILREQEEKIRFLEKELDMLRKPRLEVELQQSVEIGNMPVEVTKHMETIIQKINRLPRTKKKILKFLVIRYPAEYTYSQLAEWVGYSESTIYKSQLKDLAKLGLIKISRNRDGYHFRANLEGFIKKEFSVYSKINEIHLKFIENYVKSKILNM
jgi:hypothetical protein